ncbi:MAG: MFS transporter [Rhodospirillaceae bacterium]|jgi:predicted MFS family arabinose efflux permease|nr:MFS transporter [Rhodospirillaceae bacterium]
MNTSTILGGIGQALSNPHYRLFWAANGISTTGRWVYRTAVLWLTWHLTNSTFWLGVMAFADVFPMVVLSIFAGAISDRMGYVRVIKVMQLCYTLVGIAFTVLIFLDVIDIWLVLGLTICHGIIEAMSTPPRLALVNALVDRKDLSAAVALNSATFNACRIVGPGIAGPLLVLVERGVINADLVFAISTLAFVQLYIAMFFLPSKGAGGEGRLSWDLVKDMGEGVSYVWGHSGIWFLMLILGATGILIRPFMEMAPGYADLIFGLTAEGLAVILSSIGAGAMVSSLWLARRGRTEGLVRLTTGSFALLAAVLFLFTLTDSIVLAVPLLFLYGYCMLITGTAAQSLMQNAAAPEMRARAVSFFILLNWGTPAIGALAMGWIASYLGLQVTIAGGAVLGLLFWLWSHFAGKRHVDQLEGKKAEN